MRSLFLQRSLFVLLATLGLYNDAIAEPIPAEIIRSFYTSYLESLKNASIKNRPDLVFSSDFKKSLQENKTVCEEYATGVCGFGADGDIYLDSQEYEQGLTLTSSGFRASDSVEGEVSVSLNVYPSVSTSDGYYEKEITFKFVLEHGAWVVDDILYADHISSKVRMREEIEFYRKNPDPDSPAAKERPRAEVQ